MKNKTTPTIILITYGNSKLATNEHYFAFITVIYDLNMMKPYLIAYHYQSYDQVYPQSVPSAEPALWMPPPPEKRTMIKRIVDYRSL